MAMIVLVIILTLAGLVVGAVVAHVATLRDVAAELDGGSIRLGCRTYTVGAVEFHREEASHECA